MSDTHRRSLAKSLSWRIIAIIMTTFISWCIIGEIKTALSIASVEFFSKLLIYYGHERLWAFIPFGKKTCEYQI